MLKNKCCLYVIISIRFFSITICNLLIEFPSYIVNEHPLAGVVRVQTWKMAQGEQREICGWLKHQVAASSAAETGSIQAAYTHAHTHARVLLRTRRGYECQGTGRNTDFKGRYQKGNTIPQSSCRYSELTGGTG